MRPEVRGQRGWFGLGLPHQGGADAQAAGGVAHATVDRKELGVFVLGGGEVEGVVRLLAAESAGDVEGAGIERGYANDSNGQLHYGLDQGSSTRFFDLFVVNVSGEYGCALGEQQVWRHEVVCDGDIVPARQNGRRF